MTTALVTSTRLYANGRVTDAPLKLPGSPPTCVFAANPRNTQTRAGIRFLHLQPTAVLNTFGIAKMIYGDSTILQMSYMTVLMSLYWN